MATTEVGSTRKPQEALVERTARGWYAAWARGEAAIPAPGELQAMFDSREAELPTRLPGFTDLDTATRRALALAYQLGWQAARRYQAERDPNGEVADRP